MSKQSFLVTSLLSLRQRLFQIECLRFTLSDKFVAGKGGSNFFGGGGSLSKGKVPSKARAVGSKGDEIRVGSVTDSLSDKTVGEAGNAMGSKCFGDEGSPSGPSKARAAGSKGDEIRVGSVTDSLSDKAVGEAGNAMGSKCFGDEGSPSGPSKARAAGSKGDEVEGDVGVGGVPDLLSDAATKPLTGVLVPFLSSGKTVCTIQINNNNCIITFNNFTDNCVRDFVQVYN